MTETLSYVLQDDGVVREWGYDTEGSGSGDLVGGLVLMAIILGIVSQLAKRSERKQEKRAREKTQKARVKKLRICKKSILSGFKVKSKKVMTKVSFANT